MGAGKTGTQDERCGSGPRTPRAAPRPLPHLRHLHGKTWGPGAAASGGICRSPLLEEPAPEEGPAPPHLLAASLPLPCFSSGRKPPPSSSVHPPPGLWAPPAATGWEAWPPPPRLGGGGASRGCHPRLRRGTRSEAPRRPSIRTRHAGAASAPLSEGRGAWPRGGVEEVRTSRGRTAGLLLERGGREDPSHCLLLPFLLPRSPLEARRLPDPTGRDSGQAKPEAKKGLI